MLFKNEIIELLKNIPKPVNPLDLDLVLEGGAFNGSYAIGVLLFLREMEKQGYIKVKRCSGTSIGAILSFMYLIDDLDSYLSYYRSLTLSFQRHINFKEVERKIISKCVSLDEDTFQRINNNILYVSYYNLTKKKHIVKKKYKNREELIKALCKSCFLPLFTDYSFSLCDRERERRKKKEGDNQHEFIDGFHPFIFHERNEKDKKIMYVSIVNLRNFHKMLLVRNEQNPYGRILSGVLDSYNFFSNNYGSKNKTKFCSMVNDWTFIDYFSIRLKEILSIIFIYIIFYIKKLYIYLEPCLNNNNFYFLFKSVCMNMYKDMMLYFCI